MSKEQLAVAVRPKALEVMATRLNLEPAKMYQMLKNTVFRNATDEEMMALVVVANEYRLNPMIKQIYAFPQKGGGIVPVVSIDGWISVVNSKSNFDGCEFEWQWQKSGLPMSCTCIMYVKDRSHPVKVTEYYDECYRKSEPWNGMPKRMLRHKAYIQSARIAFGLAGIYDEDEARDIVEGRVTDVHVEPASPEFMGIPDEPQTKDEKPAEPRKRKVVRRKPVETEKDDVPMNEALDEPEPSETETTSPIRELTKLMVNDDVGEDQILSLCIDLEWEEEVMSLEDLSQKSLLKLISTWQKVLPQLKSYDDE